MAYTPNNPLVPGDPYMYDLRWIVKQLKLDASYLSNIDAKISEAVQKAIIESSVVYYDTTVNMINGALEDGAIAFSEGYYKRGDNGACLFYITSDYNQILAASFYLTLSQPNLWAIPIYTSPYINAEVFGVHGDGISDDTDLINAALQYADRPIVFQNTYKVIVPALNDSAVKVPDNAHIIINGSIFMEGCGFAGYDMILIKDVENVRIEGSGKILADRLTHTGSSGEWGHALTISTSDNISITGITILNAWGDGIYVRQCHNILIDGVTSDSNRRNGCSIISGSNIQALNSKFINSNGTAPENGIDIEPNADDTELFNIQVSNCDCTGNNGVSFGVGNRYIDNAVVQFSGILANSVSLRNEGENCQLSVNDVNIRANSTYYPVTASNTKKTSDLVFNNMIVDLGGYAVTGVIYMPQSFVYNIAFIGCIFKNGTTDRFTYWTSGSPRGCQNNKFINSYVSVPASTTAPILPSSDPDTWYGDTVFSGCRLNTQEMILTGSNYILGSTGELIITGTEPGYSSTVTIEIRAAAPLWIRNESGVAVTINGNNISGIVGGNPTLAAGSIAYIVPVPIIHKAICTIYTP